VSLARRLEILLYAKVQLDAMPPEPAPATGGQGGRFGDLLQPE
jgi:hypothetical protein